MKEFMVVGLSFDLSIQQGDEFSVVFIADDNLLDYLVAEKNGTTPISELMDSSGSYFAHLPARINLGDCGRRCQ